jgi:hypothetical protein
MVEINECPICSGDRDADMKDIRKRLTENGLVDTDLNPGGFLLMFRDGRELQVSGMCNHCDIVKIDKFLT